LIDLAANLEYALCMAVIAAGIAGMVWKRNLFKMAIALAIISTGLNLLLVTVGYRAGLTAPIYTGLELPAGTGLETVAVDPIPQALALTNIVIGACITALALSLAIRLYGEADSLDSDEVGKEAGVSG
jgi:multicomponent Na+:H+ antiporter subunit C